MTPTPKKPTQDELAKALNLTSRRVRQLIGDGMPSDSLESALAWRKAESQGDSAEQLRKARIKLVDAQRERVELESAKISGKYHSLEDILEAQGRCFAIARAHILSLEHRLPPRLEGLTAAKMQKLIREDVVEMLTQLSKDLLDIAEK